jgi:hypothetical protein
MVTQTYIFKDLPKAIINDDNGRGLKFTQGIEQDINSELEIFLKTQWELEPAYRKDLVLQVEVPVKHAETLRCLIHNLHSGKLISTNSI